MKEIEKARRLVEAYEMMDAAERVAARDLKASHLHADEALAMVANAYGHDELVRRFAALSKWYA